MKKIIVLIGFLLLVSCTTSLNDTKGKKFTELAKTEQVMFNMSCYDSSIIYNAVVIDDNTLIYYDKAKNEFIKVKSYDAASSFIIGLFIGALIAIFIAIIVSIIND
jgi:hypothetical protein